MASQFGAQEWLMKRASLPWSPPSITLPLARLKKNVWLCGPPWISARICASSQDFAAGILDDALTGRDIALGKHTVAVN
jgi:hypothetical protein